MSELAPDPYPSADEQAVIDRFDRALAAPESAVFTCPWPKCPHGADCVHASWQLGDVR